ncbi:MAG: hypothetical protein GYB68_07440 [Chloroflexi bacterium]|nr:hypothetical protein [Chloroflexota bacterium]
MSENPLPNRKSPRLKGYDYRLSGAYFVTICSYQRGYLFGEVADSKMVLSRAGAIAQERWLDLPNHHSVGLDAFIVMPNHVHGIVILENDGGPRAANARVLPMESPQGVLEAQPAAGDVARSSIAGSLSAVVGSYKSAVTRQLRRDLNMPALKVWQNRYHDHIIRTRESFEKIQHYIWTNPGCWERDRYFSED